MLNPFILRNIRMPRIRGFRWGWKSKSLLLEASFGFPSQVYIAFWCSQSAYLKLAHSSELFGVSTWYSMLLLYRLRNLPLFIRTKQLNSVCFIQKLRRFRRGFQKRMMRRITWIYFLIRIWSWRSGYWYLSNSIPR